MQGMMTKGVVLATGAEQNVSVGFEPDLVILNRARGATETVVLYSGPPCVRFDSGSEEIKAGDLLASSAGGSLEVVSVTLVSGTWAGGDAAGWMQIKHVAGTVADNNTLNIAGSIRGDREAMTNAATVNGAVRYSDVDIDTEVGTPAAVFVKPYAGGNDTPAGFTVAAGALVDGEFVWWTALRCDD